MSGVGGARREGGAMTTSCKGKKRIVFEFRAEPSARVFVAGSFNGWDPEKHPLKFRDGLHRAALMLPRGRHEYKFVVDGVWCVDPDCNEWTPNNVGSLNSVVTVG
jgi:1,4-alpha-glucan branching enzyme